ncbi:MAG TPA: aminotransferase class V-fold PLP-dependent enzyme [Chloroflexota bacterium]|nr:aminotransferase class V-fold PLP-dependent enzyme [Chloroflexota bacterium]
MDRPSIAPLIDPSEFIGLEGIAHLCAGGEAPILGVALASLERFARDKAGGMAGRERLFDTYRETKSHLAWLVNRPPDDIAFLGSTSDGVNLVAQTTDWRPGDNVVVADVEFPSLVYPWTRLAERGVETRVVASRAGLVTLDGLRTAVDARTRILAISQVSFRTGQRVSIPAVANIAWQAGARLLVDATHALGVVPVDANYCDYLVSSCYKWLFGTHGLGVFVVNRSRLPTIEPAGLGWHSVAERGGPAAPTEVHLRPDADRLEAGNPAFPAIYALHAALTRLAEVPERDVESHISALAGLVLAGLRGRGYDVLTPGEPAQRAGNVCFASAEPTELVDRLAARGVLVWGSEGRVRVSAHIYNGSPDVDRFFKALDLRVGT